jgi:ADP-ribosyl-[dinitrogen reductase] hydrolase
MNRDKIKGLFLGCAIGDALGMAVETYSAQKIAEKFGRITTYLSPKFHKWFDNEEPGTWTDDTQLTLAVAEGIIQSKSLDPNAIASWHIEAFKNGVKGWGGTTRQAIKNLMEGIPWNQSGIGTDIPGKGLGNGVAMKIAPAGAYMAATNPLCQEPLWSEHVKALYQIAIMTHKSSMGVASGLCHAFATFKCLLSTPENFDLESFIKTVVGGALMGQQYLRKTANQDSLFERMKLLYDHEKYDISKIITELKGSCYVYDSLPFTYMFFVKNPQSIEQLYDCISAGGDTDSNGSMLATLLGALHGTKIFPQELVDGLQKKEQVLDTAERFADALGVA